MRGEYFTFYNSNGETLAGKTNFSILAGFYSFAKINLAETGLIEKYFILWQLIPI